MLTRCLLVLSFTIPIFLTSAHGQSPDRPNVLMIMVDDLGYSDLGCYGGEIETPHLDALATDGLRFSQFYNTAKCHSSRVSLLTGQYCIAAGDTALLNGVTSAEVLRAGGYSTLMTGKWHLNEQPTDFGFQRYFGHLSGACNYFRGDNTFRLDGEPWPVPAKDFYTTVANVDYAMEFLNEAEETNAPWYLYVAFNAPHAPLQALKEDYDKYRGRYDAGWDTIRQARVERQRELGLFGKSLKPSPRPEHVPAWESLSEARREFEIKRMTALAAMIDRVDQEIGRLKDHLSETGQLDNTLIWFVSDNGACPYDRISQRVDADPINGSVSWSDSTGWAWARNTPFRYYKQNQFEGGISSPAIVHWPAGLKTQPGSIVAQPAHLIDVMPTMADLTGCEIPSTYPGRELRPVSGQSLRPIFDGQSIERVQPLHFVFASDRGLREGNWKAVSFRNGPWELYDVDEDRTELNNLAESKPDQLKSMADRWNQMAEEVVRTRQFEPADRATEKAHTHPEWTDFSRDPRDGVKASGGKNKSKPDARKSAIRARKNTSLKMRGDQLHLTFTGDDPGLAFDALPNDLNAGPYTLTFELQSDAIGNGEVYFTTERQRSLPNGERVPFDVMTDGKWHSHAVKIATDQTLQKIRLDVSDGKGTAKLKNLRLLDSSGRSLVTWPGER